MMKLNMCLGTDACWVQTTDAELPSPCDHGRLTLALPFSNLQAGKQIA